MSINTNEQKDIINNLFAESICWANNATIALALALTLTLLGFIYANSLSESAIIWITAIGVLELGVAIGSIFKRDDTNRLAEVMLRNV